MRYLFGHIYNRHSNRHMSWLLLPLLLLCLTACSSADEDLTTDTNSGEQEKTRTQLYIYVYAPQTAVPTRAYPDDDVDPIANEAKVYSLQIWVFTHTSNQLLGYFSPSETTGLNKPNGYEVYQMTIDEDYAETEEESRERVDVYVLANVKDANCHLTLDHTTTREELEAAVLAHGTEEDAFGLTAPVTMVTAGVGLPMSGALRDQKVVGSAPVLRLDNSGQIAQVLLRRTVSKLRFAFANQTGSEALTIKSIKLNADMIPEEQYLFMSDENPYNRMTCHIKGSGYNTTTPELLAAPINDVPAIAQPVIYAWGNEELEPLAYESMLDAAAADGNLAQRQYYLRESDKQLQGEIKYQIGETGEEQTATFQMVDKGGFSRNHIWTVYAYQAQARLQVVVVNIAPWKTVETNYEFYNW